MAIAFDAAASATWLGAGNGAISWDHTVGSGSDRIIIAGIAIRGRDQGDETVQFITRDSVNFTHAGHPTVEDGLFRVELWYQVNPTVGSFTIACQLNGSVETALGAASISLHGVHQTTPIGATAGQMTGNGATVTTNITTQHAGSVLVDLAQTRNDADINVKDTNQTNRAEPNDGGANILGMSTKAVASAGATDMGWIDGQPGRYWAHVIAELVDAAVSIGGDAVPQCWASYRRRRTA